MSDKKQQTPLGQHPAGAPGGLRDRYHFDDQEDLDSHLGSGAPGSAAGFTFGVVVSGVAAVVLAIGAWFYLAVPAAAELAPSGASMAPAVMDAASGVVAGQLVNSSGRSFEVVAEGVAVAQVPTNEDPDTVAGDVAASTDYAETLAALAEAERAASEQLAISQQDAAAAEAARKSAEADLASEESAAAREIDNAVAAAIAAAESQTTAAGAIPFSDPVSPVGPTDTGSGSAVAPVVDENSGSGQVSDGAPIGAATVLSLVRKYFPAEEVTNAMAVARCESGLGNRVGATNANGTRDYGLFQLNDGGTLQAALRRINEPYTDMTHARSKALDSEINVRMARVLWDARGWQPWVCAAKLKIVSGLYQRSPGSMYGKYNEQGRSA